jgi:hypothetical protein
MARRRRFSDFHSGRRSAGFRCRLIFTLDNFVLFGHKLIGVDDFNPFIEHRPLRKQFLARIWWNQKSR